MLERGYQYGFSERVTAMYDTAGRERKAQTMVAVLEEHFGKVRVAVSALLTVGGSAGVLDNYLADHVRSVVSIDIDTAAVEYAQQHFTKANLKFMVGDAMAMAFPDASFDVVICSQVYEHVPSAERMFDEIFRVLKPGGICYFAANNRLMWNEPHYHLPLLSVMPRGLAHLYMRLAGRGRYYYEKHYTYWGLRRLVRHFLVHDYTRRIAADPVHYQAGYMIRPGSLKARVAVLMTRYVWWAVPGYIWLLEKPVVG